MKLPNNILKGLLKVFPLLGAAVLSVALPGCVNDDSLCPEPVKAKDHEVWVTLKLANQGISPLKNKDTRADEGKDGEGHTPEDATAAENYIDIDNDIEIVLVNKGLQVMKKFTPDEYNIIRYEGTDYKNYDLNLKFNSGYLYEENGKIGFGLMIVANKNGMYQKDKTQSPFTGTLGSHIRDYAKSSDYNSFEYEDTKGEGEDKFTWIPSIEEKQHIPMCGIKRFDLDSAKVYHSSEIDRIELGTLDMQRALTKIRVIDNFSDNDEIESIKSVSFHGLNKDAGLIPYYSIAEDWYVGGTKVLENGSVDPDYWDWTATEELLKLPGDDKTFTCYLSEYSASARNDFFTTVAPWLAPDYGDIVPYLEIVTVDRISKEERTHKVEITDKRLTNKIVDLARNHIYEFIIGGRKSTSLDITVNVKDWEEEIIDYDYTQNVGVADNGELRWYEGTYDALDDKTFSVTVKPFGKNETPTAIEGSFTLSSPVGGKWSVSLTGIEGEPDAFYFIDEYGNETDVISGPITDPATPTRIKIMPRYATTTYKRSARMQVVVTLLNGQSIIADVVGNGSKDGRNYATIVQNRSI